MRSSDILAGVCSPLRNFYRSRSNRSLIAVSVVTRFIGFSALGFTSSRIRPKLGLHRNLDLSAAGGASSGILFFEMGAWIRRFLHVRHQLVRASYRQMEPLCVHRRSCTRRSLSGKSPTHRELQILSANYTSTNEKKIWTKSMPHKKVHTVNSCIENSTKTNNSKAKRRPQVAENPHDSSHRLSITHSLTHSENFPMLCVASLFFE